VKKIRVYIFTGSYYICGIEFFDKDDTSILKAGMTEDDLFKEVILKDGERLVGVRSTLLDN